MIITDTFSGTRTAADSTMSLVPSLGYLHEGHLSLIEAAARDHGSTVVSLFVNPTQFGDQADLDAYPWDLERDAALAEAAGADVLFVPRLEEVYPNGAVVTVHVDGVGDAMEGRFRSGHFEGVATVVAKLFAGLAPDRAYFGKKDAQQLAVVRNMTTALRFPTTVVGLPTVRESDGLALSSRNMRLGPDARAVASMLSKSLFFAADLIEAGERNSVPIIGAVGTILEAVPGLDVEYVEVADARTARPVRQIEADAFVAVAAYIGGVRLIDNIAVDGTTLLVDRGSVLTTPSVLYGRAHAADD